jgi:hypothetical protein
MQGMSFVVDCRIPPLRAMKSKGCLARGLARRWARRWDHHSRADSCKIAENKNCQLLKHNHVAQNIGSRTYGIVANYIMINVFIWRGDQQSQCIFGHRTYCCVFAVNYYAGFGFPLHGALGRANQSENWSVRTQDQVCGCSPSLRSGTEVGGAGAEKG